MPETRAALPKRGMLFSNDTFFSSSENDVGNGFDGGTI
jgi:hypothetical protein